MVLSGYLFAKLLDGKNINYPSFIWNRFLRLAPLLIVVVVIVGLKFYLNGGELSVYIPFVLSGLVKPTLPNGGWSITVELHFYLMLPLLLFLSAKSNYLLLLFLGVIIVFRILLYQQMGEIQSLSYWTIVGRVDQFVFGILAYQYRDYFKGRHLLALAAFLLFAGFYWYLDSVGGFYSNYPYPSANPIWIYVPTVEGLAYAALIVWYDESFNHSTGPFSRFLALIGTSSYSIYLLHVFFVFDGAKLIDEHVFSLANFYVRILVAPLAFLMMIPIAWASYRFIELPFLRFRTRYIIDSK